MTESDLVEAPGYKVKRVEPVIKGSDVQARVFTLAPGEAIPWHYHRQSTDYYFVLEGVVSISTREPEITVTSLSVGSSHKISPETPHLVAEWRPWRLSLPAPSGGRCARLDCGGLTCCRGLRLGISRALSLPRLADLAPEK